MCGFRGGWRLVRTCWGRPERPASARRCLSPEGGGQVLCLLKTRSLSGVTVAQRCGKRPGRENSLRWTRSAARPRGPLASAVPALPHVKRGRWEQSQAPRDCPLLMTFDAARGIPAAPIRVSFPVRFILVRGSSLRHWILGGEAPGLDVADLQARVCLQPISRVHLGEICCHFRTERFHRPSR